MVLKELLAALDEWAPLALQEEYDNSGLITGDPGQEVAGILVSLDLTPDILAEALARKCNVVVSHHPFLFRPIKKVIAGTTEYSLIREALLNNIALVAMHTNVDNSSRGLNALLCERLGLTGTSILSPKQGMLLKLATFCPVDHADRVRLALFDAGAGHIGNYDQCSYNVNGQGTFRASDNTNPFVGQKNSLHFEPEVRIEVIVPEYLQERVVRALLASHPYEEVAYDLYPLANKYPAAGAGMIGALPQPLPEARFLEQVKALFGLPVVRTNGPLGRHIEKVAVCSGSGSFVVLDAIRAGADACLTADLKYHDFQLPPGQLLLADIGHFESEVFVRELISEVLKEKFPNFAVLISEREKNPVNYF